MAQDFLKAFQKLDNGVSSVPRPSSDVHQSFLGLAKQYLDPLAADISEAQHLRLKEQRKVRKRKRNPEDDTEASRNDVLRMRKIHVDGFNADQVWQQAQKVLDATADEVDLAMPSDEIDPAVNGQEKALRFANQDRFEDQLGKEGLDYEVEGTDDDSDAMPDSDDEEAEDHVDGLQDLDAHEDDVEDEDSQTSLSTHDDGDKPEELVKDKFGLNDGFFSIDAFNKQSDFLERQDAKGDPNDGAASDEEEIDWSVDPTMASASVSTGIRQQARDKDDDDDEEAGATFGDADLNAPDTDEDDEVDAGLEDMANDFSNTNEGFYKDFFAPPARQRGQDERRKRNKPRSRDEDLENPDDDDDDATDAQMQRAMADVERDLLDDDDDGFDSEEDAAAEADTDDQQLSTHERRMKAFGNEIKRLEKENLDKREWALLGETVAPARPENALLEEDLDFERAGKPVPIATEEVNESIEEMIKRRILNNEFDELSRRRPELDGNGKPGPKPQREEISDTKPQRGLAEEYEDEYLRKTDPNYVDKRSEATKKAHALISAQWLDISAQLDSLSNYHFKPRPPEATLDIRTNAPTIQMEEARPTAGADVSMTGLAPQEIYKPGQEGRQDGEVMTKGGTAVSKEEDSRDSKKRRRNREKARAKKAGVAQAAKSIGSVESGKPNKKADKKQLLTSLKKGNVKVIDKKGELQDVEGNAVSVGHQSSAKAAALRL